MKKTLFILLSFTIIISLILLFLPKKKNLNYSFYHWSNTYNQKDVKDKLYIKILDIDYSTKLELVNTYFKQKPKEDFVPVVYITNETMKNVDYKNISKAIRLRIAALGFSYEEIQIDCDWSNQSKSNYFNLLQDLKKKLNKTLSATIRLHQIKYYDKTGIPPVDYGLLMYYNMSDITKKETKNSILDTSTARKYHYNFDAYKLKLKLALPLYSQAVQFRYDKALDIFEGVILSDFNENFKMISPNIYKALKSRYFKGRYIYKNDIFRFEDSKEEDIKLAIKDFFSLSKNSFEEIIFYTIKYKNKYNLDELIKEI